MIPGGDCRPLFDHGMTSAGSAESLPPSTARPTGTAPRHGGIPPVRTGACSSHLQVVRDARRRGLPSLLILEDDVLFDPVVQREVPRLRERPCTGRLGHGLPRGRLHREDAVPVAENVMVPAFARTHIPLTPTRYEGISIFGAFHRGQRRISPTRSMSTTACSNRITIVMVSLAPQHLAWVESRYSPVQERMADRWYLRSPSYRSAVRCATASCSVLGLSSSPHRAPNGSANKGARMWDSCRGFMLAEFLPGIKTCVVEQERSRYAWALRISPARGCSYLLSCPG